MPLAKDVQLSDLAAQTENFSGADLENLCREAGMMAIRELTSVASINLQDPNELANLNIGVYKKHFDMIFNQITPSLTPDIIKAYDDFTKRLKGKQASKATPSQYG